jgi:Fuc2NAc and GlcNAc transferase
MNQTLMFVGFPVLAFALSMAAIRLMLDRGIGLSEDVPNQRSLHQGVVPRGGGVAFVVAIVLVSGIVQVFLFPADDWLWYIGPFVMMAALGWVDDRSGLGIRMRLLVQCAAAALATWLLLPTATQEWLLWLRMLAFVVVVVGMVWVTNLYNFMDGMDGLAASQAVIVFSTMSIWFATSGVLSLSVFCLIGVAATAAFLRVNWHPARVFMGDTGSLSLGMVIAVLSVGGVLLHGLPPLAFLVLMGVFLFDATFTLLRRMVRREPWWQSHRSHLYQRASRIGLSQPRIVGFIVLIDVLLAILASLLVYGSINGVLTAVIALLLLIGPTLWLGRREVHFDATVAPR